jgi:low affinity Fe/Cu permease
MPALEHAALAVTRWTGGPWAFIAACAVVLLWAVLGPVFGFSNSWQLVINTGTTIITFLMVFLIQRSQNKDTQAIELKLNELVAAIDGASNRLINVEDLDESELRVLHAHYRTLARLSMKEERLTRSHSIEQAEARHRVKTRAARRASA